MSSAMHIALRLSIVFFCIVPPLPVALVAWGAGVATVEKFSGNTMGSTFQVQYVQPADVAPDARLQERVRDFLAQFESRVSTWRDDSDVTRFNRAPAGSCQAMPQSVLDMLRAAETLSRQSDGAYDLTMGELSRLHGFGPPPHPATPPHARAIQNALDQAGHRNLSIQPDGKTVCKRTALQLDFNSLAAGYTVDRVAAMLEDAGIRDYLVEITGELKARGHKPGAQPWRIGVEIPRPSSSGPLPLLMTLELDGLASSTSGDYRNWREVDGQRWSHTLDPRTGMPVRHALASVTVLHPSAMQADALSTLLMVLGPEDGAAWAARHDVAALFIVREGDGFSVRMSDAFARIVPPEPAHGLPMDTLPGKS